MSKKRSFKIAAVTSLMALPLFTLTSCDSGEVDYGGSGSFDLGARYDEDELLANPTLAVTMPEFLLAGDAFTHDVPFTQDIMSSEYGSSFQSTDPAIVVNSAGQIATAEGDSVTENTGYIYDPDHASFNLEEQNSFPANFTTEEIRDDFENRMEAIELVPFAQVGSLAEALAGDFTSVEAARVYEVAVESVGLIGSDQGEIFSALFPLSTFGGEFLTGATARISRSIQYNPTTTNAEFIATGQIEGNVDIIDVIINLRVLLEHDGRGRVLALEPTEVIRNSGVIVEYNGIFTWTYTHTGTFTYTPTGLGF